MPREVPCDLFAQIDSWSQVVSQQADRSVQRFPPSPRNLRPRPTPKPGANANQTRHLASISANPRVRKAPLNEESAALKKPRKRARKMLGNTGNQGDPMKGDAEEKKRGRPLGSKNKTQPVLTPADILVPSSPSKSSSTVKSASPKRAKSRANTKTDASIDVPYLKSCNPSVWLKNPAEALQAGPIPPETRSLYQKLADVPLGSCIPAQLKVQYEQEIHPPLNVGSFLPMDQNPFPMSRLQSLKETVDEVVKYTAWNNRKLAHERQWGTTTVTPLIDELKRWPDSQHCVLMNVESCAIDPPEIRMLRPDGHQLESASIGTRESSSEGLSTTARMVDVSLGLVLKEEDEDVVHRAFSNMLDHDQSLNQSLSYIRDTPLLVNFELKKSYSDRDPRVQLAIWNAAWLKKMQYHQWDMSMPMPGVTVDGSEWFCYLFFVRDSKLIMMGPLEMGSTQDHNGTFKIAYKLYILMKWGKTDYERWFKKHILTWCQHKAAGTIPVEAGLTSLRL